MSSLHYDSNDRDDGTFKRCPFCGGEADLRIYEPVFTLRERYYYVKCLKCGAMSNPTAKTASEAIEDWNRRVGDGE